MVRTTTGSEGTPAPKTAAPKMNGDDRAAKNAIEVDDSTWGRITSQASIQQRSPAEVVTAAVEQAYGADQPTGAVNSGAPSDPNLQK